jgi:hypothetical protein
MREHFVRKLVAGTIRGNAEETKKKSPSENLFMKERTWKMIKWRKMLVMKF